MVAVLVEGHCLILPMESITASRSCDEDVYNELMRFKKQLQAMFFAANRSEVLFIEHVSPSDLSRRRHTVIECIPIPRDAAAESVSHSSQRSVCCFPLLAANCSSGISADFC